MMLPVRNGQDHVESLPDGRDVYINGARVADVTEHKAFRNSVRSAARLYDFQAGPKNIEAMTFASPDGGRRVSRCWQLPKDYAEMVERRRALEAWAELHFGFMGRSPDHVASCVILYMAAVRDYYRFARDNDLLTYVIINPQADRSKAAHAQADPFLAAGVVDCMVRLPGAPAGWARLVRISRSSGASALAASNDWCACANWPASVCATPNRL